MIRTTASPAGLEVPPPLGPKWGRWAKKLRCASDPPIPADCRLGGTSRPASETVVQDNFVWHLLELPNLDINISCFPHWPPGIQSSHANRLQTGGSDAHPSFLAHLPHLGPSGGDFKASRRNCMWYVDRSVCQAAVAMSGLPVLYPLYLVLM